MPNGLIKRERLLLSPYGNGSFNIRKPPAARRKRGKMGRWEHEKIGK